MSKALEALEKFLDDYLTLCEKLHTNRQEKMLLDKNSPYNVLKTYLEFIEKAEPSEALEALESYINNIIFAKDLINQKQQLLTNITIIKQALLKAEKEHKALEIIKKTKNIKVSFYENGSGKHYKIEFDKTRNQTITEEEFNLLKEVLE